MVIEKDQRYRQPNWKSPSSLPLSQFQSLKTSVVGFLPNSFPMYYLTYHVFWNFHYLWTYLYGGSQIIAFFISCIMFHKWQGWGLSPHMYFTRTVLCTFFHLVSTLQKIIFSLLVQVNFVSLFMVLFSLKSLHSSKNTHDQICQRSTFWLLSFISCFRKSLSSCLI